MYQFILTEVRDHIAFITLNDPAKSNALTIPMAAEMFEVLEQYRFDPEVRVIVLRGSNGRFCAGGDITSMKKRVD